jgi:drug/metabolite transporter (DMT)-like permease
MHPDAQQPAKWLLILAFAAVYVIWGSTYFSIRYAIESLPPFFMAGFRYSVAGGILLIYSKLRGGPRATKVHWWNAALIGALLLLGGNGVVCWAEQRVPSSIAALLLATVPLWLLVINWTSGARSRPTLFQVLGIFIGMAGLSFLFLPSGGLGQRVDVLGAVAVLLASVSWALGTMRGRKAELPKSPWLVNGMEMFAGGVLLLIVSAATGEPARIHGLSLVSGIALIYLILFGSIVGFSAYVWLNTVTTPARLSTYAYVNPVVAMLLGTLIAGEPFTLRAAMAMLLILFGVVLLSLQPRRAPVPIVCPAE